MRRILKSLALAALLTAPAFAAEISRPLPAPALDLPANGPRETAVLAGGCFWGIHGVFQHVKGVEQVVSGYSGGRAQSARYDAVGRGDTGHAEAVRIVFDPRVISYARLLQVFFSVMDPTTLDSQGPDYGPQYRSEVFAASASQRRMAEAYIAQLSKSQAFSEPIVTRISNLGGFYPAEPYHQDFLIRHPDHPYIVINDRPKIEKLKRLYPGLYRAKPVTLARS